MRYSQQPLQTFRLRNFKAVRDSGVVKFSPLTVFIGNNGSGKSSLVEGLETFQFIISDGLDEAMNRWRGFEFVYNESNAREAAELNESKRSRRKEISEIYLSHPLRFDVVGNPFSGWTEIAAPPGANEIGFRREHVNGQLGKINRDLEGKITHSDGRTFGSRDDVRLLSHQTILNMGFMFNTLRWQFIDFHPHSMGEPRLTQRARDFATLHKDGSNIADYLNDIRELDSEIFDGIIETLKYVLPYADGMRSAMSSEIGRQRFIQMEEGKATIPGWLLSTGTLRILALLAVLRHPNPPPLLCIEEIENGLDPRTLNLVVEEIQRATQSGKTQVVCTTHSPYFLDLVPLSSIIVVERDESGQPTFVRPDEKSLGEWATQFAPGQLYTMSQLTRS